MLLARFGLVDLAGYRQLHPDVADELIRRVLEIQEAEQKAEIEKLGAILEALQKMIGQAALMVAKTVASRPSL